MFGRSVIVMSGVLAVAFVLLPGGVRSPSPAYACTGSTDDLTLDHFAAMAGAIAIVDVTAVGGAANETPPLPPGTPIRSIVGGGGVPDGFDFAGYRAAASVRKTIVGSVFGGIEIDSALRARMEEVVRRWEAGERFAPCFFGSQHRYEANTTYLAFLARSDVGWETIAAYALDGDQLVLADGTEEIAPWNKRLLVGEALFARHFSAFQARTNGPGLTNVYGDLWFIEEPRVPLDTVLAAIATIRQGISPPTTGDAGLAPSP